MFNQLTEEELIIPLDLTKYKSTDMKNKSEEETLLTAVSDIYLNKMLTYMKSVPHITPTQFELNLRHQKIKNQLIKELKHINKSIENCAVNRLVDKVETRLESLYKSLAKENASEYKKCQLGFTLGWKCNVNHPNRSYDNFDDRF